MPPPDDATRLHHILDSALKAVRFTSGKSRDDLDSDELLALALVRLLEVIGEASTGVTEEFRTKYPEIPWRQMADTRNRLIHGYFDINYELVWETTARELPPLIAKLEKALAQEGL
ncbi:MAG: DUF86 domain-containing protein [Dehalococcoidales bacterium]|jgi:uncharacterized protein with HEPN domain|nr:DUF86 domain-containing protein [Dehalococcoidales bacterium]